MTVPQTPNNFFDEGSPYLSHPLLTPERTATEVDHILDGLPATPRHVLDIGCGFGRHAIEFARRGCSVVAIDPSPTMLSEAARHASLAGVEVEFRRASGSELQDVDKFDLALCLFTSLGQQTGAESDPDEEARGLMSVAHSSLVPGGTFVVEVQEQAKTLDFLPMSETLGPEDKPTLVTRRFDPDRRVLSERFETPTSGATFDLGLRLFTQAELIQELMTAGFEIRRIINAALAPPPPTFVTVFATCPTG